MPRIQSPSTRRADPTPHRRDRDPRSLARVRVALLAAASVLAVASCERRPTKAEYVDDRIAAECAERRGEAFTLCRLEVIEKYMAVPLEELQKQFPAPVRKGRLGCA